MINQTPRAANNPPPDVDEHIWVRDSEGRWWMMCEDNTHPRGFICCLLAGHTEPHKADFLNSREEVRW